MKIITPRRFYYYLAKKNIIHLDDKKVIEYEYKNIFNRGTNLNKPQTFNEKLNWIKLNDRKKIYTKMVDKYEAKIFAKEIIGDKYIVPTIGVYNNFDEIDFSKLPNQFVMKCTHDSGGVIVVKDKKKLNLKWAKKKINKNLNTNFFYIAREWPYKDVKPRIIIEKYLGDNLTDYRLYCFNGEPKYIYRYINKSQENGDKPEPTNCNIYNLEWEIQNFRNYYLPDKKNQYKKPDNLDKMIEISRKLSKNTKFLRVDFFELDKLYLGELTFFPGGGLSKFYPDDADLELGKLLKL